MTVGKPNKADLMLSRRKKGVRIRRRRHAGYTYCKPSIKQELRVAAERALFALNGRRGHSPGLGTKGAACERGDGAWEAASPVTGSKKRHLSQAAPCRALSSSVH